MNTVSAAGDDRVSTASMRSDVARTAVVVGTLTLVARIIGFGRWLVFSKTVGDTCLGDVYTAANQLPNVLFEVVAGGVLAGVVVPVLARQLAATTGTAGRRRADAARTTSGLLCWTLVILTPAGIAALALSRLYGRAFVAPTCTGGDTVAAALLVMFVPQLWLYGLAVVSAGVLQAHGRFVAATVAPLLSSAVVIGTYAAAGWLLTGPDRADVAQVQPAALRVLGWGTTAGVLALAVSTVVPMLRIGLPLRPTLRFAPEVAGAVRRMAAASLAGLIAQQAVTLLMTLVARTSNDDGAVTRLVWANAIYLLPYAVLAAPLIQVVFPRLTEAAAGGGTGAGSDGRSNRAVADLLRRHGPAVIVLSCAGAGGLVAVAVPLARVFVLGPGSGRTEALAWPIVALAPGVVGIALLTFASRTLLAVHAARPAGLCTVTGWLVAGLGVLVSMALPAAWVVTGIGASVSVGLLVGAVLGWMLVGRALPDEPLEWRRPILAGAVGGVLAAAPVMTAPLLTQASLPVAVLAGFGCGVLALVLVAGTVRLVDPTSFRQARSVLSRG